MGHVVVGIAPSMQTVRTLEQQLQAAGLPLDSIDVIAPDDVEEGSVRVRADDALLLDDGATRVPGISPPQQQVESFAGHTLAERLADIDIPDSEFATYAAALHNGRRSSPTSQRPRPSKRHRTCSGALSSQACAFTD